ncbi:MAG: hypothetical protein K1Y02_05310 [Candidatus Hydrogenedentes bacterium]|nr:hypothetical protein [Candidatus Hydrogenedentota bacterium]
MAVSCNQVPGGTNTLYMDGHVSFIKYKQNNDYPVNALFGNLMQALYG